MILSMLSLFIFLLFPCGNYGNRPKKIIGSGRAACSGERPYQASILRINYGPFCGGAILDQNHILTAAHCMRDKKESELSVGVGCGDLMDSKLKIVNVSKIHIHPNFHYIKLHDIEVPKDDIAILKIDPPLLLDKSMKAVKLPKATVKYSQFGMMAGWGRTEFIGGERSQFLMKIPLHILHLQYCPLPIPETQFCAIDPEGTRGVGNGDSGNPLIIAGTAVGILSYSSDSLDLPAYFADIFFYLSFIENIVSKDVRLLKNAESCDKVHKRKYRD